MKNIFSLGLALFAAATFAQASNSKPFYPEFYKLPAPACADFDKTVTLQSGTILLLETSEKMTSDQVTVGKPFRFRVVSNVMADGEIAIRTGAFAMGRIKSLTGGTYNAGDEIRVELMYVQAVDGTSVPLMGDELTITGRANGSTTLEFGTSATSHVTNNTTIKVD